MKKEFAIFKKNIETKVAEEWSMDEDLVLRTQNPREVFSWMFEQDWAEDFSGYCIEEYEVDEDGEFVNGSDYDTLENFEKRYGTWYAVLTDNEDNDWGTGSHSLDEAQKMVAEYKANGYKDAHIAVIDDRTDDALCIDEIR